jgi:hypothetical protein
LVDWFDPGSLPAPTVDALSTVVLGAADGRIGCFREIDARPSWTAWDE